MTQSAPNPRVWTIAAVIALIASLWFLGPQLSVIVLTVLLAFIFYPLYKKIKGKKDKSVVAASLTLSVSFLVVIIPLVIVIGASAAQLAGLLGVINQQGFLTDISATVDSVVKSVNDIAERFMGTEPIITGEGVASFLRSTITTVVNTTIGVTMGIVGGLPQFGIALIIYIFLFIELLLYGPKMVDKLKNISPFGQQATEKYLSRIGLMANAMVKGQLIIAMTLALIAALLLIPLGYGAYTFLFFIVFTILNFIPLGAGLILVPLALYGMATGQFWLGLIIIILYSVSGNLDPLMRAKLIPKTIQQSVAVTMIATFCGIAYFGMLGVVYGPIIMLLITSTLEMYADQKKFSDKVA